MSKFLQDIAAKMIAQHGTDFSKVVIVLPANRAKLFLKKHLFEKTGKPFWLPRMMVMPEFVEWLSGQSISSSIQLTLSLYEAYSKVVRAPDDFGRFCSWAPVVLNDFNDVDQYLVDPAALFSNLRTIEQIENWSLAGEPLSSTQQRYLHFWSDIGKMHEQFRAQQELEGLWSYGSLARRLIVQADSWRGNLAGHTLWMVGMTSFTPAEDALIRQVQLHVPMRMEWDADAYYVNDPMNEAGKFLRTFMKNSRIEIPLHDSFARIPKSIGLNETVTPVGEVFALAAILEKMTADELNDTAVVLADTSMTEPLMHALPLLPVPVNLALGLPLRSHSLNKWITLFWQMRVDTHSRGVHHRNFLEWIRLSASLGVSTEVLASISRRLTTGVMVYVSLAACRQLMKEHLPSWTTLFDPAYTPLQLAKQLNEILVQRWSETTNNDYTRTVFARLAECMQELTALCERHAFVNRLDVVAVLWQQFISREQVRFQGEPVHGLQVLSMVETRALDFSTVMIIGANEDTLPGNIQEQTYIPWDVRGIFKMPLPQERESTYAYSFYRLIQRASNIQFFYSAISSDFKGTEPSRYIAQLTHELRLRNTAVTWHTQQLSMGSSAQASVAESMPNDDFAKSRLDSLLASGLSPSAIGKFNRCPLDFYYRYIIGLGETEEVEEEISAATFGNVVHDVLEFFYRDFSGRYPQRKDYEALWASIPEKLTAAFARRYSEDNVKYGFNALAFSIAEEMLIRFVDYEISLLDARESQGTRPVLVDVETSLARDVDTLKHGWDKPVRMKGKADRIDKVSGRFHILDYKTGRVKESDYVISKSLAELFDPAAGDSGKLIQLLSYIYMYAAQGHDPQNITAGFYSFVNHSAGYAMLENNTGSHMEQLMQDFESALVSWIKKIHELPAFVHNPKSQYCEYCRTTP